MSIPRIEMPNMVRPRSQRPFGTLPALEKPLGIPRTWAELGDRDVKRADTGVEVAVALAVAGDPLRRSFAVTAPANRVDLKAQRVDDERGRQSPHQIRTRLGYRSVLGVSAQN